MSASPNPFGWVEIYVQDMNRAVRFYEAMLARKLTPLSDPTGQTEMMVFAMNQEPLPGATGALVKMEGFASGGNSVIPYFICEDCAIEAGRVVAAGGKVHQAKMSIGEYGNIALVLDTEGNMVGLHSMG